MTYFHTLLGAILLTASHAQAQDTVTWEDDVRGWYIGVDKTIGNGCFMVADYDGGTILRVGFHPDDGDLNFFVGNDAWQSLENGKLYPLSVEFGNKGAWAGDAEGVRLGDTPMLRLDVSFEDDDANTFIEEFMRMTVVEIIYQDTELATLRLTGTYAAMQEAINCQETMFDQEQPGDDPFGSSAVPDNDPFN